eukprot:340355-Prymnesium_polylepis.1
MAWEYKRVGVALAESAGSSHLAQALYVYGAGGRGGARDTPRVPAARTGADRMSARARSARAGARSTRAKITRGFLDTYSQLRATNCRTNKRHRATFRKNHRPPYFGKFGLIISQNIRIGPH